MTTISKTSTKTTAAKSFPTAKAAERAQREAAQATERASEIAVSLGLTEEQFTQLRAKFSKASKAGALPGDLLRLVADEVQVARDQRPNPYASKLSYAKAQLIRAEMAKPGAVRAEVARKYGVSGQSVKSIVKGLSYKAPAGKKATRH